VIPQLRIFKKAQYRYRQLSEKIGIASSQKTPGPQIIITIFRRRLAGLSGFSRKMPEHGAANFLKTASALLKISEKP